MSRPKISPSLFAQLVEQAPGRVKKRLDSDPCVANQWVWTSESRGWSIRSNEETVHLQPSDGADGLVSSLSEVDCSCLLSPKCFHILACCSVLEIQTHPREDLEIPSVEVATGGIDLAGVSSDAIGKTTGLEFENSCIEISDEMRAAARGAVGSLEYLLRIGARNAGVLLQTEVLRSAHLCRASEFVTLSNALVGIVEGVRRIRSQSDEADATTLRDDLVHALWVAQGACARDQLPSWMIGQTRRRYAPVELRKVQGLLAEPVLTRSGYAGVSVLLQDVYQGGFYSINEIRPGDANLIHQAYLGGIDLGGIMVEAKSLCRSTYSVQGLMASEDGRLGKGKDAKWGRTKSMSDEERSLGHVPSSLSEQVAKLQRWLEVGSDARPAGWDVLEVTGIILGASGDSLIVDLADGVGAWRFNMPVDAPQLEYRHNFQLLARCSGMRLRWYVRLRFDAPQTADVLAVRNHLGRTSMEETDFLRLNLPEGWNGVCNVGLDRLERRFAVGIQTYVKELCEQEARNLREDSSKFVQSIERRLAGMAIGGTESVPGLGSKTLQRDCQGLRKLGLAYGALLLEHLSMQTHAQPFASLMERQNRGKSSGENNLGIATAYLACAKYIEGVKYSLVIDPHLDR